MIRTLLAPLLVALLPASAAATGRIVNVQAAASRDAEEGLSGELGASLRWATGNTDLTQASGSAAALYLTGPHRFFLTARAVYGIEDGETSVNNTFEHLRYRRRFEDWLSGESFVQHEYDEFRRLQLRALFGLGPRFDLPLPPGHTAAVGSAWMLEYERISDDGLPDAGDQQLNHRWSNYVAVGAAVVEGISALHTNYWQPKFDDFADYRFLSETSVVLDVKEWLAVQISFVATYDSRPPADVDTLDTNLGTSLLFRI